MAGELKRLAVCAVMTWGLGALAQEATASAPAAEPQKVLSHLVELQSGVSMQPDDRCLLCRELELS